MDGQLADELFVKACGAPSLHIERQSFGPRWRKRKLQLTAERLPVALTWIFPATEPFEPVGDVADFIAINPFEKLRGHGVADCGEATGKVPRKIQVRLLEGQAQPRHIIHRVLHAGNRTPKVT